ncbi:MAG: S-layer homology domain-containing protein [Bacillota bacterium]
MKFSRIMFLSLAIFLIFGNGIAWTHEIKDNTKTGNEDLILNFVEGNFTYYFGAKPDILQAIKVISLPENGILKLGSSVVEIYQEIPRGQLGNLAFYPNLNWNGSTSFDWQGSDGGSFTDESAIMNIVIQAVNDQPTNPGPFTLPAEGEQFKGGEIIRVSWQPSIDPDGDIITYQLYSKGATDVWVLVTGECQNNYYDFTLPLYNRTDFKFRVRAYDGKLDTEYIESTVFTIDSENPTTPVMQLKKEDGSAYDQAQWAAENISVILSGGSDNLTGVSRQYRLNDGEWTTADTAVISEEGNHILSYRSMDGAGNYSAVNNVTLRIDKTPPQEFEVSVNTISKNEIKITGTTTDSYAGLEKASPYEFYCSANGWTGAKEETEHTFNGLTPNTPYEFQMKAFDQLGQVRTTNIYTGYTLADIPLINFLSRENNSITGDINSGENPDGTLYYLEYGLDENFINGVEIIKNWSSDTNFTVEDLNPESTYYFRAKAKNGDGVETEWSSVVSETTKPIEVEKPTLPVESSPRDDNDYLDNTLVQVIDPLGETMTGVTWNKNINENKESIINITFSNLNLSHIKNMFNKSIRINILEDAQEQNVIIPIQIWEQMGQAEIELILTNPELTLHIPTNKRQGIANYGQSEIMFKIREAVRPINLNNKEGENFNFVASLPDITVLGTQDGKYFMMENAADNLFIKVSLDLNSWREFSNPRYLNIYRYEEESENWIYVRTRLDIDKNEISALLKDLGSHVIAEFHKDFSDLSGHWAEEEIEYLAGKYLVAGISEKDFAPDKAFTRAELAVLLVRILELEGNQIIEQDLKDISPEDWFYEGVNAVASLGIMEGVTDNSFDPGKNMTSTELNDILINAAIKMGKINPLDIAQVKEDIYMRSSTFYGDDVSRAQGILMLKYFLDLIGI